MGRILMVSRSFPRAACATLFALVLLALVVMPFTAPTAADGPEVTIKDFAFDPNPVTIPIGTTLTWTNNDGEIHTATNPDSVFDSQTLQVGMSYSYTFAAAGTYEYACIFHPYMKGAVIVTAP